HHTEIRFNSGGITSEQALLFEGINDTALQPKLRQHQVDQTDTAQIASHDIARQPKPFTEAKIQAFLAKELKLEPIQGKVGIQNQHQYQQNVQQKTEVQILQSWQVQEVKQVQAQGPVSHDILFGEEAYNLITGSDIKAAFDQADPNHQTSRAKLGDEILNYHYKGRNLKDLWQRLTGDVVLTEQDTHNNAHLAEISRQYGHYSPLIPRQIGRKALLYSVRHPELFQDGVHLDALPETFGFSPLNGALFISSGPRDKPFNALAPRLIEMAPPSLPSTEHYALLIKNNPHSKKFYNLLVKHISAYKAWDYWRRGFSALNEYIGSFPKILELWLENNGRPADIVLNYFIRALNYYHYQSMTLQQGTVMSENLADFEYQEQQNYKKGVAHSVSAEEIELIGPTLSKQIHDDLISLVNRRYQTKDLYKAHRDLTYQKTLLDVTENKSMPFMNQTDLIKLIALIDDTNGMKLMDLALSQDPIVVYNVLFILEKIYTAWGDEGLIDFARSFLSPLMNFASLADARHYHSVLQLLALTDVQYHWWQQLTLQHTEQSGYADFPTLMTAFMHFLSELKALALEGELT
ncbi:MAG TPA: hypothetical protein VI522_04575, partial [Gammaproteobacteria bacterium]|nr:hypothetical protein [Gammaproteobacteria bacterium]